MNDSQDELRQRGLELQAALPEPVGWGPRFLRKRKEPSQARNVVDGAVDLFVDGGVWALLLAVPVAVVYILRRIGRARS